MTRGNFLRVIFGTVAPAALIPASMVPGLCGAGRGLVDINSASLEELKMLPGIQEARALAIVKNRPYLNKGQLLSRKILSAAEYRRIRDLIIARQ